VANVPRQAIHFILCKWLTCLAAISAVRRFLFLSLESRPWCVSVALRTFATSFPRDRTSDTDEITTIMADTAVTGRGRRRNIDHHSRPYTDRQSRHDTDRRGRHDADRRGRHDTDRRRRLDADRRSPLDVDADRCRLSDTDRHEPPSNYDVRTREY